jgi:hypothetical protein
MEASSFTLPNTTCLPSSHAVYWGVREGRGGAGGGAGQVCAAGRGWAPVAATDDTRMRDPRQRLPTLTVHRKNWEPLVLGPALAMDSTPGGGGEGPGGARQRAGMRCRAGTGGVRYDGGLLGRLTRATGVSQTDWGRGAARGALGGARVPRRDARGAGAGYWGPPRHARCTRAIAPIPHADAGRIRPRPRPPAPCSRASRQPPDKKKGQKPPKTARRAGPCAPPTGAGVLEREVLIRKLGAVDRLAAGAWAAAAAWAGPQGGRGEEVCVRAGMLQGRGLGRGWLGAARRRGAGRRPGVRCC